MCINNTNASEKTNLKYKNILILHDKLSQAGIPHELRKLYDGWIIIYRDKNGKRIGDVITHGGSYGEEQDLLEAFGFPECERDDLGYLGVEQAFELFENANEWDRR